MDTDDWFGKVKKRKQWSINYWATGDYQRTPDQGPAPEGWSSHQTLPAAPVKAATQGTTCVSAGVGRIATWSKWNYAAHGYRTTLDPATMQDGGPDLGPRWSKVIRRVTYDMHSRKVLEDVNPKGMSLDALTGPILNAKANGRDIITEFHFIRGSWKPPVNSSGPAVPQEGCAGGHAADGVRETDATTTPPKVQCGMRDGIVIPDEVLRTQAAMGCPLLLSPNDHAEIGRMPCIPHSLAQRLEPFHREHNPLQTPLPLQAMVARPVGRAERDATPEALAAVAKE